MHSLDIARITKLDCFSLSSLPLLLARYVPHGESFLSLGHRPPSPRARSLERYDRGGPRMGNGRTGMVIDSSDPPPPQGTRRPRSPDRQETGDVKRRRLDLPPTTPGSDNYRPDPQRSTRMDIDDTGRRDDSRRLTSNRNEPSRRERSPPVQSLRHRDDQIRVEIRHEVTPARSQAPSSVIDPPPTNAPIRSRAPLPPQDQVMRDQMRHGRPPQGSDGNNNSNRAERAPIAPKADRSRGSGVHRQETDDRPPPRSEHPNTRSDVSSGGGNHRSKERGPESSHNDRFSNGGPPAGESSRGRGRHFATSGSNNIPIMHPKGNFGMGRGETGGQANVTNNNEKVAPLVSEPSQQNTSDDKGRTRTSRFGPSAPNRDEAPRDKDRSLGENMVQIAIDVTTSKPTLPDALVQRDPPPHLDTGVAPLARQTLRIEAIGPPADGGPSELPYDTPAIPSMEPLRISDEPVDDSHGMVDSASPQENEGDSMGGQRKGSLLARLGPGSGGDNEVDAHSASRKKSGRAKRPGRGGRR